MLDGNEILERVTRITLQLSSVQDLDSLARTIHGVVEEIINVQYSGVYLLDFSSSVLRLWYTKGFSEEEHREAERTAWDRHPGWVIRNKEMLHVPDTEADTRTQSSKRAFHVRSRLWLPIMNREEAVGAIGLASKQLNAFAGEDIIVLKYAAATGGLVFGSLRAHLELEKQLQLAVEQRRDLEALSSPLVEVSKGVVVLPIIGQVDDARAKQITEKLLHVVVSRALHTVILDLTGVAAMADESLRHLEQMHLAVRLLGADCVFTGISGQTATLMTHMGIDIAHWTTYANVRMALTALRQANRPDGRAPNNKSNR